MENIDSLYMGSSDSLDNQDRVGNIDSLYMGSSDNLDHQGQKYSHTLVHLMGNCRNVSATYRRKLWRNYTVIYNAKSP